MTFISKQRQRPPFGDHGIHFAKKHRVSRCGSLFQQMQKGAARPEQPLVHVSHPCLPTSFPPMLGGQCIMKNAMYILKTAATIVGGKSHIQWLDRLVAIHLSIAGVVGSMLYTKD